MHKRIWKIKINKINKEAAEILKGRRNQLGYYLGKGNNQDSNKMEEEDGAKKATNNEVFFDDKIPIARRAAATEFLIKAHKFVRCGKKSLMSSWLQGRIWW